MMEPDAVAGLEVLEDLLTVEEMATKLAFEPSSIRRMIAQGTWNSRLASLLEPAKLLDQGRMKGVPDSGVRLITAAAVESAMGRRTRKQKKAPPENRHDREMQCLRTGAETGAREEMHRWPHHQASAAWRSLASALLLPHR